MAKKLPLVSTITPVLNGEKYISRNLQSIIDQTYPKIEIIVVDNFSTDKTREISRRMGAKVYKKGPERAFQDNYGVKKAKGKYVFITGCDMILDKDYIEQAVECCEKGGYDAIYAHVLSEEHGYWSKVKGLERLCYIGDKTHEAARFFKRDVFLKLGGFRTDLVLHADDYDMQKRLDEGGYKTGFIKAVETHIDEVDSIKNVFLKSFYYGYNTKKYLKENLVYASRQLSPIRGAFFKNWRFLVKKPYHTLGLIIFKIVQYFSASIGLTFAFLGYNKIAEKFHRSIYRKKSSGKKGKKASLLANKKK